MSKKDDFIDHNPYIVYTGQPDTSGDDLSGGSGGGHIIVNVKVDSDSGYWQMDKTFSDIQNALANGKTIFVHYIEDDMYANTFSGYAIVSCAVSKIVHDEPRYYLEAPGSSQDWQVASPDDYPYIYVGD